MYLRGLYGKDILVYRDVDIRSLFMNCLLVYAVVQFMCFLVGNKEARPVRKLQRERAEEKTQNQKRKSFVS
jgi:hypothetical protein